MSLEAPEPEEDEDADDKDDKDDSAETPSGTAAIQNLEKHHMDARSGSSRQFVHPPQ
jgi:hypothetical protein